MSISYVSFDLLEAVQQASVNNFHENTDALHREKAISNEFSTPKTVSFSAKHLFYKETLLKTNPNLFPFMTKASLNALEKELMLVQYHLGGLYQCNELESRRQTLTHYINDIEKCDFLIKNLRLAREKKQPLEQPTSNKSDLYHFLFESELNFFNGQTVYIRKRMGDFNYWRLYWVWTGMMLRMAIVMMSSTFYNIQQTDKVTSEYQDIWSYISWMLYFARFLINFSLVLKHTIPCTLWMSEQEIDAVKKQGLLDRFIEQLNARKFELANDFIWGLVNLGCHLWWVGSLFMDYLNNAFTVVLLIADLYLTIKKRQEEIDQHACDLNDFKSELAALNAKLQGLSLDDPTRLQLEEQKSRLERALAQYLIHWKYKEKGLNADYAYAAGVVVTFFVVTTFLIPYGVLPAMLAATIGLIGAGSLFVVACIYSAYKAYLEISKAQEIELNLWLECKSLLNLAQTNLAPNALQVNHLRYQQLEAEADYQHQLASYHQYMFARTVLIECLFPVVLFSTFTFLSFNLAAGILAVGFALAVISYLCIEYYKKPKDDEWIKRPNDDAPNLNNAMPSIEKKIRDATPYRPLQWLNAGTENSASTAVPQRLCDQVSL